MANLSFCENCFNHLILWFISKEEATLFHYHDVTYLGQPYVCIATCSLPGHSYCYCCIKLGHYLISFLLVISCFSWPCHFTTEVFLFTIYQIFFAVDFIIILFQVNRKSLKLLIIHYRTGQY